MGYAHAAAPLLFRFSARGNGRTPSVFRPLSVGNFCLLFDGWCAIHAMDKFCSSGRNPQTKKIKILGEANGALEERRLQEAQSIVAKN